MPGDERDGEAAPLVTDHHGRVAMLVREQRGDGAHDDARGHDADQGPTALPGQTHLFGHPTPAGTELRAQFCGQSLAQFAPAPGEGEHHAAAGPPPLPVHQRYSWEKAAS